ncbi:hypothetical protein BDZ97DRAFT_698449 [Flammula alnicola]|nr:hypothetical protein BDZ97DRAFT_698449 [Flammula alnicola]
MSSESTTPFRLKRPAGLEGINISKQNPAQLLQTSLNLENNHEIFTEIRNKLKLKSQKHLDVRETPACQQEAVGKIKNELKEEYPDLFDAEDSEQRMYLAIHTIYKYHYQKRTNLNNHSVKGMQKNYGPSKKPKALKRENGQTGAQEGSSKSSRAKEHVANRKVIKENDAVHKHNVKHRQSRSTAADSSMGLLTPNMSLNYSTSQGMSTSNALGVVSSGPTPAQGISANFGASMSHVSAMQSSSQSTPTSSFGSHSSALSFNVRNDYPQSSNSSGSANFCGPSTSAGTGQPENRRHPVQHFLEMCVPPMGHFFPQFVEFGCSTEEYLLGVSTWPPEQIYEFLKKIFPAQGKMREMDILILQNHFKAYFGA